MESNISQNDDSQQFTGMKRVIGGCIVIALILLILFTRNQYWDSNQPFDTDIFGTYGDFLSGVLGAIIGLYSIYLLIKTFQNQAAINQSVATTNDSIIKANTTAEAASQRQYYQTELQLFDNKFRSFLETYHEAINNYKTENGTTGRMAFEKIAELFIKKTFINSNYYKQRCNSATNDYMDFYAEYRIVMSVHLRILYLLVSLISKSKLEDEDKVQYAKLIRGQMSSAEMLIVRYNCRSCYGQKMQKYCNQFNLIKHLPIMSLLEFKEYKKTIMDSDTDEKSVEKMLSGLDAMFITLRKMATKMFKNDGKPKDEYKTSHRYTITMSCSDDKLSFIFEFRKDKTVNRTGGGVKISPEEKAIDCFNETQQKNMFKDFLNELFIYSNFEQYNEGAKIESEGNETNTANEFKYKLVVSNNKRLVLSDLQMNDRDNPVEELEQE